MPFPFPSVGRIEPRNGGWNWIPGWNSASITQPDAGCTAIAGWGWLDMAWLRRVGGAKQRGVQARMDFKQREPANVLFVQLQNGGQRRYPIKLDPSFPALP